MSISKKNLALVTLIGSSMDAMVVTGNEGTINTSSYGASLESRGLSLEVAKEYLQHDKEFIVALTATAGEKAVEAFTENKDLEALIVSAAIDEDHAHTVRIQKIHEPIEGKPQHGLVQIHSGFAMNAETSEEFKKISKTISKNIKAICDV